MYAAKIPLKQAQKAKQDLLSKDLLDHTRKPMKEKGFIYFPLKNKTKEYVVVEKELENNKPKIPSLEQALTKVLSEKELEDFQTGIDIIGDIAIIDIPLDLRSKEKLIGNTVLKTLKSVNTVLRKTEEYKGKYRVRKLKHLAGIETKETIHKENGVKIKLNVETVYFSQRMSTERKRIASLIKKEENVLVLYSGCAPYPVVISKLANPKKITGVELNPEGHKYALMNAKLNNIALELINQDVALAIKELEDEYDRILMPAPDNAKEHINLVAEKFKKAKYIHYYAFSTEKDIPLLQEKIKKIFPRSELKTVKCGHHSPYTHRVCVDIKKFKY